MGHTEVIFSLPGTATFHRFQQAQHGTERFVLHPFNGEGVELRGGISAFRARDWSPDLQEPGAILQRQQKDYEDLIDRAIGWCKKNNGKVVISRTCEQSSGNVRPGVLLERLRKAHPGAFVYGLVNDSYGCWIGATPEPLLHGKHDRFRTVALAGTRLVGEHWTRKEYAEQQVVTDYLLSRIGRVEVQQ